MSWEVWRTDVAERQYRDARTDIKRRVEALETKLEREGCNAGDYRLTGNQIDHMCCTHLRGVTGNWRVIFGFPEPYEIAILRIGRHDERRALNVYDDLYGSLGLKAPPPGRRTKPPCCHEHGQPPVDLGFFDELRDSLE